MEIILNADGVKQVADNIDLRRQEMEKIYRNKIIPLLQSSEDCLSVSGLSYDEVIAAFDNVFNSLDSNINNLTNDLNNKVIPKYMNSSNTVNKMFNQDFANKMNDILKTMKS